MKDGRWLIVIMAVLGVWLLSKREAVAEPEPGPPAEPEAPGPTPSDYLKRLQANLVDLIQSLNKWGESEEGFWMVPGYGLQPITWETANLIKSAMKIEATKLGYQDLSFRNSHLYSGNIMLMPGVPAPQPKPPVLPPPPPPEEESPIYYSEAT